MLPRLHADWHWVLSHSWSLRFTFLACVLSGLEVFLPLVLTYAVTPAQHMLFAATIGVVTAAAFAARFVAQKHDGA